MSKGLQTIFHQYFSPLCNYAFKILNDDFLAEEVVQTVFIQLYEKNSWHNINNIEGFLLRCVKNKCIDYLRTDKKYIPLDSINIPDQSVDFFQDVNEDDIEPLFYFYAAKLPPKTREVFLMSREGGLSYKEIAEELNISVKTVENQMSRALSKMKDLLKNNPVLLLHL